MTLIHLPSLLFCNKPLPSAKELDKIAGDMDRSVRAALDAFAQEEQNRYEDVTDN